ncbi:hypothetical protein CONPUDRAFT_70683 [Coniophora puteana RWD-64-598 SS2]|uniref:Uncharacterized protein n=1 Tax=Coniophora puteana (strain RWD-64-598) TaxID=741705 RepID=A0A5M3MY75_CONPW|nr:uncharacterized protein CONPUDRAFT_70683 [Coniophora puteana RWD-64-598 SS2]EIW83724.1 hypothetical protein CONPUDRAFT_70683 [Coniophora puteana RWD-64-598 SS2]
MSSSEIEAAWTVQVTKYATSNAIYIKDGMSFLATYRIGRSHLGKTCFLTSAGDMLSYKTKRHSSKRVMTLYTLPRPTPRDEYEYHWKCWPIVALGDVIIPNILIALLNAMMGFRVYAIYGRSNTILIVISACYIITQALTISEVYVAISSLTVGANCEYGFSSRLGWLTVASAVEMCGYDIILLVMVLYCAIRHMESGHDSSLWTFNTFIALLARDHVFYILFSLLAMGTSMPSYIPSFQNMVGAQLEG